MGVQSAFRFIALSAFLALVLPVMWLAIVLRVLHNPLRWLGLPDSWLPLDVISFGFVRGMLFLGGIELEVHGRDRLKPHGTIYMANHTSGLDPFIVAGAAPEFPMFIFKRELMFFFPPIFLMGYIYGHVPINRSNRESAIKSLASAARKVVRYRRSICVFPEGTRSQDGKLLPLKSGPFYMAVEAKGGTVTPVYIHGTSTLMVKGALVPARKGVVVVEYLQPIACDGMDHDKLKEAVSKSLTDAQMRWAGERVRAGGYSAAWGAVPIATLVYALLWLRNAL